MPTSPSKTLSVMEVAKDLGVSKNTVYRLIEADDLLAVRVGRLIRIPRTGYEMYCRAIGLV